MWETGKLMETWIWEWVSLDISILPGLVFDTVGIETSGFALRRALWTYQGVKGKRIKS